MSSMTTLAMSRARMSKRDRERAARRTARALQRLAEGREPAFRAALIRFWLRQADRVIDRLFDEPKTIEVKITAGELLPAREDTLLFQVMIPFETAQIVEASALAAELVGVEPLVQRSPQVERMAKKAGKRIKNIGNVTRNAVREQLRLGTERGYNLFQLANGVPGDGFPGMRQIVRETYRNRALAIVRTELAFMTQEAAADRYEAAGITHVRIADGPGCGWKTHNDADKANDSIRTIAQVRAFPIAHPNCRRVSIPVIPE